MLRNRLATHETGCRSAVQEIIEDKEQVISTGGTCVPTSVMRAMRVVDLRSPWRWADRRRSKVGQARYGKHHPRCNNLCLSNLKSGLFSFVTSESTRCVQHHQSSSQTSPIPLRFAHLRLLALVCLALSALTALTAPIPHPASRSP